MALYTFADPLVSYRVLKAHVRYKRFTNEVTSVYKHHIVDAI